MCLRIDANNSERLEFAMCHRDRLTILGSLKFFLVFLEEVFKRFPKVFFFLIFVKTKTSIKHSRICSQAWFSDITEEERDWRRGCVLSQQSYIENKNQCDEKRRW